MKRKNEGWADFCGFVLSKAATALNNFSTLSVCLKPLNSSEYALSFVMVHSATDEFVLFTNQGDISSGSSANCLDWN